MGWIAGVVGRVGMAKMMAIVFAIGFAVGWSVNGWRLGEKKAKAVSADLVEKVEASNVVAEKSAKNAEVSAKIDSDYFKEYENAKKSADYWRGVANDRVRDKDAGGKASEIKQCGRMDDEASTNGAGVGQVDLSVAAITGMREVAGELRAQVLALQEKVKADHATINGEGEGDDKQ